MNSTRTPTQRSRFVPGVRAMVTIVALIVLVAAMALNTTVVEIGSKLSAGPNAFSPEEYGQTEFPKIQAAIEKRAVSAATLAAAIQKDQAAATKQYGVATNTGPVFSVEFTGTVGEGESGIYRVKVAGVPDAVVIRIQTGPAINGTELRDATGTVEFGDFTNQIQYQNAGSALNNEMKKAVLSKIDTSKLTGKTVSVAGAFQLINPNGWLVTPVRLSVQ